MSRAADPLIGAVVAGRYEIVREIGKGGMGTIYEVVNTRLGRSFALKTLSNGSQEPEVLARFRREAEIVAKLTHPNILDVVDWDTLEDGSPCMIMEYLRGGDLSQRLRSNGPMGWPEFARVADQVLAALAVAHRASVVHRDLKPQNIFLATDDNGDERVKLLDFGISKLRDARTFTTTDAKVMGTPAYMPPEQAEGRQDDIGPATDVWAMGTILYEMATAKVAFEAPSIPAILYRVVHGRPKPLKDLRPDSPPKLVELIERSLTVDLAKRLDNVEDMRAELRAALADKAGVSFSEPLRPRSQAGRARIITPATGLPVLSNAATEATMARLPDPPVTSLASAPTMAAGIEAPAAAASAPTNLASIATGAAPTPRSARPAWLIPAMLGGVVAIAAITYLAVHKEPTKPAPVITTPVETPIAKHEVVPAPPIPVEHDAPPPAKVQLSIESQPAGADVYRLPSEVKVGVTPYQVELDRGDGTAVYVVKKRGYSDAHVELGLQSGGKQTVTLAKLVTVKAQPKVPPDGTATKTTPDSTPIRKKGDPVDPFGTKK